MEDTELNGIFNHNFGGCSKYNCSNICDTQITNINNDVNCSYDEHINLKLQNLNNELILLMQQKHQVYDIYDNLIYSNAMIQEKINIYKNILTFKHVRKNSAVTFISLQNTHIHSLLNNQIEMYNKNFKKINAIVYDIDYIENLIHKINFNIIFI